MQQVQAEERWSEKYGKQVDLDFDRVRVTLDSNGSMRIFFGGGVPPVYVPKDSAMYRSLMRAFKRTKAAPEQE